MNAVLVPNGNQPVTVQERRELRARLSSDIQSGDRNSTCLFHDKKKKHLQLLILKKNLHRIFNFAALNTPKVSVFSAYLSYERDTQVSFDSPVLNNRGVGVSKGSCRMETAGEEKKKQPSIKCGRVNREQGVI